MPVTCLSFALQQLCKAGRKPCPLWEKCEFQRACGCWCVSSTLLRLKLAWKCARDLCLFFGRWFLLFVYGCPSTGKTGGVCEFFKNCFWWFFFFFFLAFAMSILAQALCALLIAKDLLRPLFLFDLMWDFYLTVVTGELQHQIVNFHVSLVINLSLWLLEKRTFCLVCHQSWT